MTIRRAVLHGPDGPGRVLPLLVALCVCCAAVATAAVARLYGDTEAGLRLLAANLTIHLPAAESPETDAARVQAVLARIRDDPNVAAATPIPAAQLRAVLEPWLGGDAVLDNLRLPTLIDVTLVAGAAVDPAGLEARLVAIHPEVVVDVLPPPPAADTDRVLIAAVAAAGLVVVLAGLTAVAAAAAVRAAVVVRAGAVGLLHRLGADDRRIAAPLIRRTALRILFGVVLGFGVAAVLWLGALRLFGLPRGGQAPGFGGDAGLSIEALAVTVAVPLVIAGAGIAAGRWAALRALASEA